MTDHQPRFREPIERRLEHLLRQQPSVEAVCVKAKVPARTVYRWMAGDGYLRLDAAAKLFEAMRHELDTNPWPEPVIMAADDCQIGLGTATSAV